MGKWLRDLPSFSSLAKTSLALIFLFSVFYLFNEDSIPDSTTSIPLRQSPIQIPKEKEESKRPSNELSHQTPSSVSLPLRKSPIQTPNEKKQSKKQKPSNELSHQTPSSLSSPFHKSPIQIPNKKKQSKKQKPSIPIKFIPQTPPSVSQNLDNELEYDFTPYVKLYKSGRVERLPNIPMVPPGVNPPTGVTSKDLTIDQTTGLSVRLYLPRQATGSRRNKKLKFPVLIYFHGGAFVIESAFSTFYHHYLNVLVSKTKIIVISVDYRLAPEHPLPAAYEDAWTALKWVLSNCKSSPDSEPWLADYGDINRIYLGGDSAGGNIAHNAVIRAGRDGLESKAKINGLILLNPYFWGKDPVGTEPNVRWIRDGFEKNWKFVCNGLMDIDHPAVNPLSSIEELKNLGCNRVFVTIAGRDFFRERGLAYVEGLKKSGWKGNVELYETLDEMHVYFIADPLGKKANKEMNAVIAFINGGAFGSV
ncbi:hypothetical protein LUZ60_001249 [Juncus effusus]|nr:hypothetical protein LUZ60_001249 [Juncus effusus]